MKKGLLLSVVASTMIMAGGDIAPVASEAAAVPVVEEASMWDFSGQAVFYYQTVDSFGETDFDMFSQEQSLANAGIQLNAVGNLGAGFGAGFQLTGLGTLGLQDSVVSKTMQMAGDNLNDAAITKAYLTWGTESTTLKFGRQELPKGLSPFAWSEGWNVFKNTYEAALVVNTSIPDTVLVGAWVNKANQNGVFLGSNLNDFNRVNGSDGIYMVTAQNKSVNGLTLTGSYYYAAEMFNKDEVNAEDLSIVWGSAEYANAEAMPVTFGVQGGSVMSDTFENDTTAFGAKLGGNIGMFSASVAYSSVDDGDAGVFNVGGVKTPLYTQMILNQGFIANDADTVLVKGVIKALGGKFIAQYGMTTQNAVSVELEDGTTVTAEKDYNEFDFIYKTKIGENTTLLAAYVNQDVEDHEDANNVIRFWARYNF
jgi:hypothetical protein